MTSPQPLPQEGGAKSLYYKPFPLLSWEKGVRGMRPTDLEEGVLKTIGIGGEIEIHEEKTKGLYSGSQSHNAEFAKDLK